MIVSQGFRVEDMPSNPIDFEHSLVSPAFPNHRALSSLINEEARNKDSDRTPRSISLKRSSVEPKVPATTPNPSAKLKRNLLKPDAP